MDNKLEGSTTLTAPFAKESGVAARWEANTSLPLVYELRPMGDSSKDMGSFRASRMRDLELSVARSELEYTADVL
jgi:hypothetical protein